MALQLSELNITIVYLGGFQSQAFSDFLAQFGDLPCEVICFIENVECGFTFDGSSKLA